MTFSSYDNFTTTVKYIEVMLQVLSYSNFDTNAIISITRYQIEIKLPFRNDNVFVLEVLSISFNFKELML